MTQNEFNPYVGPRPFERKKEDSARFFGRAQETEEIVSLIFGHPVILVYAQSGAGKTSLFNASVAVKLEENGFDVLPLTRVGGVVPKGVALQDVKNLYVFNSLLKMDSETDPKTLLSTSLSTFLEKRTRMTDDNDQPRPRVMIFDQFEELFTYTPGHWREQREGFFFQVSEALDADPLLRVVFVIREDFLAELDPYSRNLPERLRTRYRLERLGENAALRAIKDPLVNTSRKFAEGVAEGLVKELLAMKTVDATGKTAEIEGQYIEPVQLQVVCVTLWSSLDADCTKIEKTHLKNFNVNDALSNFYKSSLESTAKETGVAETDLRNWFGKTLITPMGTRSTVFRGEASTGGIDNSAVDFLESRHIIRAEFRAGARWYELTHDRLVEPILASNRKWLEALSPLQQQAALWNDQGKQETWLFSDQALVEVEQWAKDHADELTGREQDFLAACREKQAEQLRAAREQSVRRQRSLLIGVSMALVVSIALGIFAFNQRNAALRQTEIAETARENEQVARAAAEAASQNAQDEANLARAGRLATQSQVVLDGDPRLSLLLSIESLKFAEQSGQNYFPEAEEVLRRAVEKVGKSILLTGNSANPRAIEFSPDNSNTPENTWLASGNDNSTISLWDMKKMTVDGPSLVSVPFEGHTSGITDLAFSLDGKYAASAGGNDATVRVWETATGEPVTSMLHDYFVTSVVFSPDGKYIASGSYDNTARVWEFASGKEIARVAHDALVGFVAFSPDGHWLASGSDDYTVRLLDMNNLNNEPIVLKDHSGSINNLAFSPDGKWLASGGNDFTVRLWKMTVEGPNFDPIVLGGDFGNISSIAFSPDGKVFATGDSGYSVSLWDLTAEDPKSNPVVLSGPANLVTSLAFSPDGHWLAGGSDDYGVGLWDVSSSLDQVPVFSLLGTHIGSVFAVRFSPDGKWLASIANNDPTPRLWDISTLAQTKTEDEISSYELLAPLKGHAGEIQSLVFDSDGNWLASSSADATVRLWNFQTGIPDASNTVLDSGVVYSLIFPDSVGLIVGSENSLVILWDISSGIPNEQKITLVGHEGNISTMALSSDSGLLAIPNNKDYSVGLWTDVADHLELKGHKDIIYSIVYSVDGSWLASASADSSIILWDMKGLSETEIPPTPRFLKGHADAVYMVAFSPNGKWLASASADSTVRLWDIQNEKLEEASFVLSGNQGAVYSLSFSPGGRWLASAGEDGTIQLWDMFASDPSAQPISMPLTGQASPIHTIAFSPNGRWLVAGTNSSEIRIWGTGLESLIKQACKLAKRNLTMQESQDYLKSYDVDVYTYRTCPDYPIHPSVAVDLRDQGDQLAQNGDLDETIAKYQEAREIDPKINLTIDLSDPADTSSNALGDPESRAKGLIAQSLMADGDLLAQAGDVRGAIAKYNEALVLDPASVSSDLEELETRAKDLATQTLIDSGDGLARQGDVKGAVEKYREALAIDPSISEKIGDPEAKAKDIAFQSLVDSGDNLARAGNVEEAIAKYREALAINPSFKNDYGDPEARANTLAVLPILYDLINSGKYQEAALKFSEAFSTTPRLKDSIDTYYLNGLCWNGSVYGYAADVKDACELLGELAPDDGNFRNSRGLNRALLGDYDGAIEDFEFAIKWYTDYGYTSDFNKQREDWLDALKAGRNPFDEKTLDGLR